MKYYDSVRYLVYEKLPKGYTAKPQKYTTKNKDNHFEMQVLAGKDARIKMILYHAGGRDTISYMETCD